MSDLLTRYSQKPFKDRALCEYPRPQMKRDSFLCLNGYWDFVISDEPEVERYEKKILVPFSPESMLSEVNQTLLPNQFAHYQRIIELPADFLNEVTYLHFGAVDQIAEIWINDQYVMKHIGGFTPFSINISKYIKSNILKINLRVQDYSDTSCFSIGKQRLNPNGIWYTPQSGIWQTVWLESVPKIHLEDLEIIPDFDEQTVKLKFQTCERIEKEITILFREKIVISIKTMEEEVKIKINPLYPWTPKSPNLYDLKIRLGNDNIRSYFGMRKFSREKDNNGIIRFSLNNQPYFLTGVLDQGYFSDGLLTAPSDEAMIDDIVLMKEMGFNVLRKHIKIEPLRWYYHCDRLGMIVWQDMINGGDRKDILFHGVLGMLNIHLNDQRYSLFGRKSKEGKKMYESELKDMLHHLKNVTSLAVWGPFNEAWGQFDSKRISAEIKKFDPCRLVDHASGWSDQGVGDFCSKHIYFRKIKFKIKSAKRRINALTEFGGFSLALKNHCYNERKSFGYKKYDNQSDLEKAIIKLYQEKVKPMIDKGLSVLIYTQLSDVENEVNGLITYDREIVKVNKELIRDINDEMIDRFNKNI